MIRFSITAVLVSATLVFAGQSLAQPAQPPNPTATTGGQPGDVSYTKNTEYDFEDDLVEGSFIRPEGEFFNAQKRGRHSSLIRIRRDFVPEMLKSAEDI
jgi:hypothetical protein